MAFLGHSRHRLLEGNVWKSVRCSDDPHTASVSVYSANQYPVAWGEFTQKNIGTEENTRKGKIGRAQQMGFRGLLAGLPDVR